MPWQWLHRNTWTDGATLDCNDLQWVIYERPPFADRLDVCADGMRSWQPCFKFERARAYALVKITNERLGIRRKFYPSDLGWLEVSFDDPLDQRG